MSPQVSGVLASCFGLMNIFARSWGGIISDAMNAKFGMRGRIWSMWVVQVVEGFMCIVMGLVTINMASPDSGLGKTEAMFTLDGVDYKPLDADSMPYTLPVCGSLDIFDSSEISAAYDPITNTTYPAAELDLPKRFMIGDIEHMDCIRNKNIVGLTVFIMIIFSICVQARHAAAPLYPPSTPAPPLPAPPCPIGTRVASAPLPPEAPCQQPSPLPTDGRGAALRRRPVRLAAGPRCCLRHGWRGWQRSGSSPALLLFPHSGPPTPRTAPAEAPTRA